MIEFFRDLQFGARLLRRSPGFTSIAVLSLGAGDRRRDRRVLAGQCDRAAHAAGAGPAAAASRRERNRRGASSATSSRRRPSSMRATKCRRAAAASCSRRRAWPACSCRRTARRLARAAPCSWSRASTSRRCASRPQAGRLLAPSDNRAVGGASGRGRSATASGGGVSAPRRTPSAARLSINGASFTVIGVTRPGFFGTTLALRAPDAWIPYMMQPVVRYSQNASSSDGADPRKPWPPQPEMAWLNVFARVPARSRGHGGGGVHHGVPARQRGRAAEGRDRRRSRRRSGQQRVALSDARPACRRCATPSRSRSTCCSRWSAALLAIALRQRRRPAAVARGRARARNGDPPVDRRRTHAPGPPDAGGERCCSPSAGGLARHHASRSGRATRCSA